MFRGTIAHSVSPTRLDIMENAQLGVTADGKIAFLRRDGEPAPAAAASTGAAVAEEFAIPKRASRNLRPSFSLAKVGFHV